VVCSRHCLCGSTCSPCQRHTNHPIPAQSRHMQHSGGVSSHVENFNTCCANTMPLLIARNAASGTPATHSACRSNANEQGHDVHNKHDVLSMLQRLEYPPPAFCACSPTTAFSPRQSNAHLCNLQHAACTTGGHAHPAHEIFWQLTAPPRPDPWHNT
jgi:hypothetical protein